MSNFTNLSLPLDDQGLKACWIGDRIHRFKDEEDSDFRRHPSSSGYGSSRRGNRCDCLAISLAISNGDGLRASIPAVNGGLLNAVKKLYLELLALVAVEYSYPTFIYTHAKRILAIDSEFR